jgi:hypothetical protein
MNLIKMMMKTLFQKGKQKGLKGITSPKYKSSLIIIFLLYIPNI